MPVTHDYEDYDLGSKTWQEAGAAIETADFVVLPVGSTEQHSHHLPVSVDTLRAENLTRIIAEEAEDHGLSLLRLPTLPYGYSEHHMRYPGTVTLMADTYQTVLEEIGSSIAEHGARRLLIINFHGGNREPIKLAADRLQRDHDLPTYSLSWTNYARDDLRERFGDEWGHAGDHETSVIELFHPDLVKTEEKAPQTRRANYKNRGYAYIDDISEEGGVGDPTNSDPEFLEQVIADTTERILDALNDDLAEEREFGQADSKSETE